MIAEYLEKLGRCSSPNQVNAVHIRLENALTPVEMFEIINIVTTAQQIMSGSHDWRSEAKSVRNLTAIVAALASLPDRHRDYVFRWVATIASMMLRAPQPDAENYRRRPMGRHIWLFTTGGMTRGKTLLLCFTGAGQRMMMPVSVFLQHLPSVHFDVLVLRDEGRNGFRQGIPNVGNNLEELVARIGASREHPYSSFMSLGVSAGAMAAVWACLHLGLQRGIAIGVNSPVDPRWQQLQDGGLEASFSRYLSRLASPPDLLLIYGADEFRDASAARELSGLVPAQTLAVQGTDNNPSGHNALYTLQQRGSLAAFLDEALSVSPHQETLLALASGRTELVHSELR